MPRRNIESDWASQGEWSAGLGMRNAPKKSAQLSRQKP
jgi:hypothetical protein